MAYLPIAMNLEDRKVVIIGGGAVAKQKITALLQYEASIVLYAKEILDDIKALPIIWFEDEYHPLQLEGSALVYAASDNRELNGRIASDARAAGALVNVVDNPANSDFVSPAIEKRGDISIAVTSNGSSVRQSINMRNRIRELI